MGILSISREGERPKAFWEFIKVACEEEEEGVREGERRHGWACRDKRFHSDCCMGALAPESVRGQ